MWVTVLLLLWLLLLLQLLLHIRIRRGLHVAAVGHVGRRLLAALLPAPALRATVVAVLLGLLAVLLLLVTLGVSRPLLLLLGRPHLGKLLLVHLVCLLGGLLLWPNMLLLEVHGPPNSTCCSGLHTLPRWKMRAWWV